MYHSNHVFEVLVLPTGNSYFSQLVGISHFFHIAYEVKDNEDWRNDLQERERHISKRS